jgi:hypothetical protein
MTSSETAERFSLLLVEVETGILLDSGGGYAACDRTRFAPSFATRQAALLEKDALLSRFPFAEVIITDALRESQPEHFVNEAGFTDYLAQMKTWRRWSSSWMRRLFTRRPPNPREAP